MQRHETAKSLARMLLEQSKDKIVHAALEWETAVPHSAARLIQAVSEYRHMTSALAERSTEWN